MSETNNATTFAEEPSPVEPLDQQAPRVVGSPFPPGGDAAGTAVAAEPSRYVIGPIDMNLSTAEAVGGRIGFQPLFHVEHEHGLAILQDVERHMQEFRSDIDQRARQVPEFAAWKVAYDRLQELETKLQSIHARREKALEELNQHIATGGTLADSALDKLSAPIQQLDLQAKAIEGSIPLQRESELQSVIAVINSIRSLTLAEVNRAIEACNEVERNVGGLFAGAPADVAFDRLIVARQFKLQLQGQIQSIPTMVARLVIAPRVCPDPSYRIEPLPAFAPQAMHGFSIEQP